LTGFRQHRAVVVAGRLGLAAAAAIVAYLVSCLVRPPEPMVAGFPGNWARMAERPFDFPGQFPHRVFAPLLAHALGLGSQWELFCRALAVLLLAVVFLFCTARGSRPVDALLVTLAAALSGAVQSYKRSTGWTGYPDDLTFALALLCALAARRGALFWLLHLANACTHEVAFFLLPWLLFVRRRAGAPLAADAAGLVATTAAYAGIRWYVGAHAAEAVYTTSEYLKLHLFPWGTVWLFVLVAAYWLAAFGPLLSVLGWRQRFGPSRGDRVETWLIVGGILATFVFAFDFSRHGNLVLVPIVGASIAALAAGHRLLYATLVLALLLVSRALDPWLTDRFLQASMECGLLEDPGRVLTCALPRTWALALGCVIALAAIVGAGAWVARRDRAARP
jgi:hypothetical protein